MFVVHVWAPVHFQHQEHSPEKGASGQVAARPPGKGTKRNNQRADSSNTARTRQANTDANAETPQQRRNTESISLESETTLTSPSLKIAQARLSVVAASTPRQRRPVDPDVYRRKCPNTVNSSASIAHANTSSSASISITTTCEPGGDSLHTDTVEPRGRTDGDTLPNCLFTHKQEVRQVQAVFLRVTINVASHRHVGTMTHDAGCHVALACVHENHMPHQNSTKRRNEAPNVIKSHLSLQIDRSTPRRTRGQFLISVAKKEISTLGFLRVDTGPSHAWSRFFADSPLLFSPPLAQTQHFTSVPPFVLEQVLDLKMSNAPWHEKVRGRTNSIAFARKSSSTTAAQERTAASDAAL